MILESQQLSLVLESQQLSLLFPLARRKQEVISLCWGICGRTGNQARATWKAVVPDGREPGPEKHPLGVVAGILDPGKAAGPEGN